MGKPLSVGNPASLIFGEKFGLNLYFLCYVSLCNAIFLPNLFFCSGISCLGVCSHYFPCTKPCVLPAQKTRFVTVPLAHSFAPSWGKRQPYWVKGGRQVFCSLSSLEPAAILGHGTAMFLTFPRQRLKCNFLFSACTLGRAPQGHQYLPWKQLYTIFHPPQTHILRSERNTTVVASLSCSLTTSRFDNGNRSKRSQPEQAQSPLPRL